MIGRLEMKDAVIGKRGDELHARSTPKRWDARVFPGLGIEPLYIQGPLAFAQVHGSPSGSREIQDVLGAGVGQAVDIGR